MACVLFIAVFSPAATYFKLLFCFFNEGFGRDFANKKRPQTKLLESEWLLAADFLEEVSL